VARMESAKQHSITKDSLKLSFHLYTNATSLI